MAEPMPFVLKESAIPIVEESSLQEDLAPEPQVTPFAAEPDLPIIEESPRQENVAPGTETTPPEVVTPAATLVEAEVPAIDPPASLIQFSSLPMLRKVILD